MSVLNLAPPHRFTVEDYYAMAEAGILAPDARVELLDGQIVDMFPIGSFHCGTVDRVARFFTLRGGERWIVRVQNPVRLNRHSEPQPDISLLHHRDDFYTKGHPTAADIFLLVEVAESSVRFDRKEKLPVYARAGIAEYWLINLVKRVIEVYREPSREEGLYQSVKHLQAGDEIAPMAFPDTVLAVAEILTL